MAAAMIPSANVRHGRANGDDRVDAKAAISVDREDQL